MLNPEDDIEKIYRDFAKNYPLKTKDSGWDEFLQKMESAPVKGVPANKPGTGNPFYGTIKKYSYWLTAAALVAIITGVLFLKNKNDNNGPPAPSNDVSSVPATKQLAPASTASKHPRVVNNAKQEQATTSAGQPVVAQPQQLPAVGIAENSISPNKQNTPLTQEKKGAETTDNKKQKSSPQVAQPFTIGSAQQDNKAGGNTKQGINQDSGEKAQSKIDMPTNDNSVAKNSNNTNGQKAINENGKASDKYLDVPPSTINADSVKNTEYKESILVSGSTKMVNPKGGKPVPTDTAQSATELNNLINKVGDAQNASVFSHKQTDKATTVQPMVKIKTSGNKYFYLGLVTGPDLSTVKFQQVKKTGYTAGLMLGVHLTNKISIETGLLYTAKKYYSSAAYFKSNSLPPPDRDDLQSINANGKFFEMPLTIKFNFINKKRYNIFLNGGVSSYFTSDEKYDLLYRRSFGNEVRSDNDDDLCANIFSIIHLSAGYEFKLNAGNVIRLEPYVKIPLAGLGVGSLPVTSGGLYISFTHSFFK